MLENRLNLPRPFVEAVTDHHSRSDKRYSVTETLGGTCEAVLKRRHSGEIDEDVSDRVWAILGTAVHRVLQESEAEPWQEREQYLTIPVEFGYELSGIFDMYDSREETVTDWKTCSVWKAKMGDFEDWRRQLAAYCIMLEHHGRGARKGEIVAIMRDHNMRKARFEKGYPPHPVMRISWAFSEEDLEGERGRIREWFSDLSEQLERPDDELSPCTADERWSKPESWAVMMGGRKKAVRVLASEGDAESMCAELSEKTGKRHYVEHRDGEDTRCESYCQVAQWCPHGRKFFQDSQDSQATTP